MNADGSVPLDLGILRLAAPLCARRSEPLFGVHPFVLFVQSTKRKHKKAPKLTKLLKQTRLSVSSTQIRIPKNLTVSSVEHIDKCSDVHCRRTIYMYKADSSNPHPPSLLSAFFGLMWKII